MKEKEMATTYDTTPPYNIAEYRTRNEMVKV